MTTTLLTMVKRCKDKQMLRDIRHAALVRIGQLDAPRTKLLIEKKRQKRAAEISEIQERIAAHKRAELATKEADA